MFRAGRRHSVIPANGTGTIMKSTSVMRMKACLLGLGAVAGLGPAAASGATPFGSSLTSAPNATVTNTDWTAVNLTAPAGSSVPVTAPVSGVLVQIRHRQGGTGPAPGRYAFRIETGDGIVAGTGQTSFVARSAMSPAELLAWAPNRHPGQVETYIPRDPEGRPRGVPIAAGERLGMWIEKSHTEAPVTFADGVGSIAFRAGDHTTGSQSYTAFGGQPLHSLVQGLIEPDGDADGYGDESQDPCPTVAGVVCQAPQPTPPVDAPPTTVPPSSTVTASFSVAPDPPCTNAFIDLDGSASRTTAEGGIVSYEWYFGWDNRNAFIPYGGDALIDNSGDVQHPIVSHQPTARVSFGYNWFYETDQEWKRSTVKVTLAVTDARGNRASTVRYLDFVDDALNPLHPVHALTQQQRDHCATAQHVFSVRPSTSSRATASSSVALLTLKNPAPTQSLGTVTLSRVSTRTGRSASTSAARATKVAAGQFAIPAGQSAQVRAPLTAAGKKLLRNKRPLKVRVVVTTVASGGDKAAAARTLTLTPKKRAR